MMNIRNIFITTGISVLFSVYSIYNILEYLRSLNNHRVKQIHELQHLIKDTNKKYNDLKSKYSDLQEKYNTLTVNYENVTKELDTIHSKIREIQKNNDSDNSDDNLPYLINLTKYVSSTPTLCDELCTLNNENNIPRVSMETMGMEYDSIETNENKKIVDLNVTEKNEKNEKNINDNVDKEFIESLSLDYNCSEHETPLSSTCTSEKTSFTARSRSSSITEINWSGLTKKFIFG